MLKLLKKLIKEPLLQFMILGGILFIIYQNTALKLNKNELIIHKADLINYMQYQANGFNKQVFEAKYAALSPEEKQTILNNYVEEEILVKEAKNLNLQENDYVIKNRLIQKAKFILKNEEEIQPNETALKTYYEDHKSQYNSSEKYSFTHVFFGFENHSEAEALKLTQDFISKSKTKFISAEEALQFSDRFPYFQNYTQRDLGFIETNFDANFCQKLKKMPVSAKNWQGALISNLGYHAILLVAKEGDKIKSFEDVKDIVKGDFLRSNNSDNLEKKIANLKNQYRIKFVE